MFKKILQYSVLVLMAVVVVACHENDRRDRDGNGASCYRNGHGSAYCHRN